MKRAHVFSFVVAGVLLVAVTACHKKQPESCRKLEHCCKALEKMPQMASNAALATCGTHAHANHDDLICQNNYFAVTGAVRTAALTDKTIVIPPTCP